MKLLNRISVVAAFIFIGINMADAQTRQEKKAAHVAEIKQLIESQNFVFEANYVNPARGAGRALTSSDYDLTITKDTIIAYLPYFGRAYVAPPYGSTEGGIKFTNTHFTYALKARKKDGWNITIKPTNKNISDSRDVQSMYLTVSSDGYASLQVISTNRDAISFNGMIQKRPAKK
ncbi:MULTISPECIES: DUF4251 domain-containing protein [unclassified Mucilaginibacter]|jgi:hypothetical protein|uniref:DUF4251 domain-containing protein n=1 Tax=unclassified Mucilaginibacter TaxID=2617802 RepID=UPI0008B3F598|nr:MULTISPECIES: DUF4251 domain-containing protein [unclassified Mucilaginibacter]WDF81059.1 DUF4251 domain-containing protein [Mucilaginibacter sp. KACC 22773]SEP41058.1 protein of unknown function [Mucilaginibacter sp. OK283]